MLNEGNHVITTVPLEIGGWVKPPGQTGVVEYAFTMVNGLYAVDFGGGTIEMVFAHEVQVQFPN